MVKSMNSWARPFSSNAGSATLSYVTLDRLLNHSGPQFSPLQNGNNDQCPTHRFFMRIKHVSTHKELRIALVHNQH